MPRAEVPHPDAGDPEGRNFRLNVAEGAVFLSGAALISSQTVVPALVARLGGSNLAVGAAGVIVWVGLFLPQIFAARYAQTLPWKKPWAIRFGLAERAAVVFLGVVVLLFGERSPEAALWLFMGGFTLMQVLLGVTTPGWFDLFAKLIPPGRRGRAAGFRNSLGGLGGFLCGLVLMWLLVGFPFPLNYACAFFGAALLQIISILIQSRLVEREPSRTAPWKSSRAYARQLAEVLRENREYRTFLSASAWLVLAAIPAGFFTVYGIRRFGAGEGAVGGFTLTLVAAQVLSSAANGVLADRAGNRVVVIGAALSMLAANLWCLAAPSLEAFHAVFLFLGVFLGSDLMARYNMSIEYGPVEERSTYIGLMNTSLSPLFLLGLAGGWASDRFGFEPLFVCGAAASLVGAALFAFRVRDPHHGRERE
ncbi:MAG: MFS transporter [Bacteroidota bacterium]